MALDSMIVTACVFGLGAVARAAMGYGIKVKNDPKIKWNWNTFAVTTAPAFGVGFAVGMALTNVPEAFSTDWFSFIVTSLVGGVGVASLQSNAGKFLKKK